MVGEANSHTHLSYFYYGDICGGFGPDSTIIGYGMKEYFLHSFYKCNLVHLKELIESHLWSKYLIGSSRFRGDRYINFLALKLGSPTGLVSAH